MKEGWEFKKLKEIGRTQTGTTPSKSEKSFYGGDIPFVRPAELDIDGNGSIKYDSELKLTQEGALKSRIISVNSILMCCIGSVGKTGYSIKEVTCNQQINTITPYDSCNGKFVYYALLAPSFQNEVIKIANSAKATLAIISKGKWEEMSIPVAPLSEQQQIVDRLDSAFAKIDAVKANAEKQLNDAKALFKKELSKAMTPKEGWEEKKFGEVCRVINGRAYSKEEMLDKGKYRLLRVGNFFTNDTWYYSDLELDEDKYCDNGDLLYAWSASFGPKIWDGEKVIYHYHIWKMECSDDVDKRYMFYWLDSDVLKKQALTNLHGSTMAHITKAVIEKSIVGIPTLSEQQAIVTHLDTLSEKLKTVEDKQKAVMTECDAMKQALLREVFE